MEIKITVGAEPNLQAALEKIADLLSTVRVEESSAVVVKDEPTAIVGAIEPTPATPKTPIQEEVKAEQTGMNLPKAAEDVTIDDLRAMGAKLKAKGIATKSVINDLGYEKLSSIPADRYAEVKEKFDILLERAS